MCIYFVVHFLLEFIDFYVDAQKLRCIIAFWIVQNSKEYWQEGMVAICFFTASLTQLLPSNKDPKDYSSFSVLDIEGDYYQEKLEDQTCSLHPWTIIVQWKNYLSKISVPWQIMVLPPTSLCALLIRWLNFMQNPKGRGSSKSCKGHTAQPYCRGTENNCQELTVGKNQMRR